MLLGAIEVNSNLNMDSADAEAVRSSIVADKKLRKLHERYTS